MKNKSDKKIIETKHSKVQMTEKTTDICADELDKLLDQEKLRNKAEVWNKLNKTTKLQKLCNFADIYGPKHNYSETDLAKLKSFFSDALEKKKLQKTKEVLYDKVNGVVIDIPGLIYQPHAAHTFTLRVLETTKHSTLKTAPKRKSKIENVFASKDI